MTTEVGALAVILGLDQGPYDKGIRDAEGKSKKFGGKLAAGFGTAGRVMGKAIAGGVAIGITALGAFSKKALSIASDLEEVQNVVDTVFEDSSGVIDKFAKESGTSFGLSELAAKQYAGTIGALLTPSGLGTDAITEMSTDLVGLSGDMASFFNIADEDAFNKLRAGISGETEPLKQLGINMSVANLEAFALSKGIDTTFNSMTQAEQATLRYQFIMDATSKVQGDFAKTSDSLANQQRIGALNAENLGKVFGSVLLPQASLAMKGINTLITGLMPAFEGLAGGLSDILAGNEGGAEKFQESAGQIIEGIMEAVKTGLPKLVGLIAAFVPVIVETLVQIIPLVAETLAAEIPSLIEVLVGLLPTIINALAELIPKLVVFAGEALLALANGIIEAIPLLLEKIPEVIISIVETLITLLPQLIVAAIELVKALAFGLIGAIPVLIEALPTLMKALVEGIVELLPLLVDAAIEIILALVIALVENAPLLLGAIVEIGATLVKGIIDLVPKLFEAGKNLLAGLAEGLKSFNIGQVISDIGSSIVGAFKDVFGMESPSKRMKKEVWDNLMPGAEDVIKKDTNKMMGAIKGSVDGLFSGLNVPSMAGAGAGAGGGMNVEFNISVSLENGSRQEAEEAGRIIGDRAAERFTKAARAKGIQS